MRIGIIGLILAVSLLPRIPLDITIPGRNFDLRVGDVLLFILLSVWILSFFSRQRIYLTPLFKVIGTYFLIVIITSSIALMKSDLSVIKAFFYTLKEIQYFLIFFVVANWIRSEKDCKLASIFLLFAGLLNAIWVTFQLGTLSNRQFFLIQRDFGDLDEAARLLISYGPNLTGESSPLAAGAFFMLALLLTTSFYFFYRGGNRKWPYIAPVILFSASLVSIGSRAAVLSAVIGIVVLLFSNTNQKLKIKNILTFTIILATSIWIIYQLEFLSVSGRIFYSSVTDSITERWQTIWFPLLNIQNGSSFFLGFGKGSLGSFSGLETSEAHNHYLRVFIESGFFGLIAFIGILMSVIFFSSKVFKGGKLAISKVIGGTTMAATVGLAVAALFQDVFMPALLNELWWILIGLTAAANRVEYKYLSLPPQTMGNYYNK